MSNKYALLLVPLLLAHTCDALIVGSNTTVSVEAFTSFPAADNDNTILGFGWMKNGFELEDNTTTCTFDDVYPISGTINLNGGTLILERDVLFANPATLTGLGTITGNNHNFDLDDTVAALPTNAQSFTDTKIHFNSDLTINSTITFNGNCVLNGQANKLILGASGEIVVGVNSTLVLRSVSISGNMGTNIRCADDTGHIILEDSTWILSGDVTFANGFISYRGANSVRGAHSLTYTSSISSIVEPNSRLVLSDDLNFVCGRQTEGGNEPIILTNSSSILNLNDIHLTITDFGATFATGHLIFQNQVLVDIESTDQATGLTLGSGAVANNMQVELLPNASAIFQSGHLSVDFNPSNSLTSASKTARIVAAAGVTFFVEQDLQLSNVEFDASPAAIFNIPVDRSIIYNDTRLVTQDTIFDIVGTRIDALTHLLNENDSIYMLRGNLPALTSIQSTGNILGGNGGVKGPITLVDENSELNYGIENLTAQAITLNDGIIHLTSDLSLGKNITINGPGTVDIDAYQVKFPAQDDEWSTPLNWISDGGVLNLQANITLTQSWSVEGSCVINGNNNSLLLQDDGEIVIQPNSTLILRGIEIQGVAFENIRCVDATSTLVLQDVDWIQSEDFDMNFGTLEIIGNVRFIGNGVYFNLLKSEPTIIRNYAHLTLSEQFTLSYEPANSSSLTLFQFESSLAELLLEGGTLISGETGLIITLGSIRVIQNSFVGSNVYTLGDVGSIVFGDGNPLNDPRIVLNPSVTLKVNTGTANFKIANMDNNIFPLGSILIVGTDARINVYNILDTQAGLLQLDDNSTLGVDVTAGAYVLGSIMIPNSFIYIEF